MIVIEWGKYVALIRIVIVFWDVDWFVVLIVDIVGSDNGDCLLLVIVDRDAFMFYFKYILTVGNLCWINLRDVLCSAWVNLLIMFRCYSHSKVLGIVADHFYFFIRKYLASSTWDCWHIWWSILLCIYMLLTYTTNDTELTWVIMEMEAEFAAMWFASMFSLAYVDSLFLSVLSSWWSYTWWIVNYDWRNCSVISFVVWNFDTIYNQ